MKKQVSFDSADGILDTEKFVTSTVAHADNYHDYDYSEVSTETELRLMIKNKTVFATLNLDLTRET